MDTDTTLKSENTQTSGIEIAPSTTFVDLPDTSAPLDFPGILFPYNSSVECTDYTTLPSLLQEHHYGFLGHTSDKRAASLNQIRQAWGSIARTSTGYQISHLAKIIGFAISTSSAVVPVLRRSKYLGAILVSSSVTITDSYTFHSSSSADALSDEVAALDVVSSNRNAINRILTQAVQRIQLAGDDDVVPDNWETIRELSEACLILPLTNDEKKEIIALAAPLVNDFEYFQNSPDYLLRAIEYLRNDTTRIPTDIPMYPEAMFHTSRVEEVLSAFGPSVPCVDIPNAPTISLRSVAKPPMSNFVARPLRFHDAVRNWLGWLESKSLKNGPTSKSTVLKDRAFEGRDRQRVWSGLLSLVKFDVEDAGRVLEGAPEPKRRKVEPSIFDL
jgi:hypothetical protein